MLELQLIDIHHWLKNEGNPSQQSATTLTIPLQYFSVSTLKKINQVIKQFLDYDEIRRFNALHYKMKEERLAASQAVKRLLEEKQWKEVQKVIHYFKADHCLHLTSQYRRISHALRQPAFWNKQQQLYPTQKATLLSLQKHWQSFIRYAFCSSQDLVEKTQLLEEIDAYQFVAFHELQAKKAHLSKSMYLHLANQLKILQHQIHHERKEIANVMFQLLQQGFQTGQYTNDSLINEAVLPLLKNFNLIKTNAPTINIATQWTPDTFKASINYIERTAPELLIPLTNIFRSVNEGFLPFEIFNISNKLLFIPSSLRSLLALPPAWLPAFLYPDRMRQCRLFSASSYFNLICLNQTMRYCLPRIQFPEEDAISYDMKLFEELHKVKETLSNELIRIKEQKPKGMFAWFFTGTQRLIEQWISKLQTSQERILTHELKLFERITQRLSSPIIHSSQLTSEQLRLLRERIEKMESEMKKFPKTSFLALQFQTIKQSFQFKTQVIPHFLETLSNASSFSSHLKETNSLLTVRCPDPERMNAFIQQCQSYANPEELPLVEMLTELLRGHSYPSINELNQALIPWLNAHTSQTFIQQLMTRFILPTISTTQSEAFKWVESYHPLLTAQWLRDRQPLVEQAHFVLNHLLSKKTGGEINLDGSTQPLFIQDRRFELNEDTLIRCINTLKALSTSDSKSLDALYSSAKRYVEESYAGDNDTYYFFIQAVGQATQPSLLSTYITKRIEHLFNQQRYSLLLAEPIILEHQEEPEVKRSIQASIDIELQTSLSFIEAHLATVIEKWGTPIQRQQFYEAVEEYYLRFLFSLKAVSFDAQEVKKVIQTLKHSAFPFPFTALGKKGLQVFFSDAFTHPWQLSLKPLVEIWEDESIQQAYHRQWFLQLFEDEAFAKQNHDVFHLPYDYEGVKAFFGESHLSTIHQQIVHSLQKGIKTNPTAITMIKSLLTQEWVQQHPEGNLLRTITHIENIHSILERYQQLIEDIEQYLSKKEYKAVHSSLHYIRQQIKSYEAQADSVVSVIKEAYQHGLFLIKQHIQTTTISDPDKVIEINEKILFHLPDSDIKQQLQSLCQHSEQTRFIYERCKLFLHRLTQENITQWSISLDDIHRLQEGLSENHQQMLATYIKTAIDTLLSTHNLYSALMAFYQLVSKTSENSNHDHTIIKFFFETYSTNASNVKESSLESENIFNQLIKRYNQVLNDIAAGEFYEKSELLNFASFYHLVQAQETPLLKTWISEIEIKLSHWHSNLIAYCEKMSKTPSSFNSQVFPYQPLQGICHVLRVIGKQEKITHLNRAIHDLQLAYCRLFTHGPFRHPLHAQCLEQIINACGNSEQQQRIQALQCLHQNKQWQALKVTCQSMLEENRVDSTLKRKQEAKRTTAFLHSTSLTLCHQAGKRQNKIINSPATLPPTPPDKNEASLPFLGVSSHA